MGTFPLTAFTSVVKTDGKNAKNDRDPPPSANYVCSCLYLLIFKLHIYLYTNETGGNGGKTREKRK